MHLQCEESQQFLGAAVDAFGTTPQTAALWVVIALVAASLPVGFNAIGKLLADWAILRSNGTAQIVVIKSSEVPPTEPLMRGLRDNPGAVHVTVAKDGDVVISMGAGSIGAVPAKVVELAGGAQ